MDEFLEEVYEDNDPSHPNNGFYSMEMEPDLNLMFC